MLCGRQPGGTHTTDSGICRATVEKRLDGTHGGINAGRACWVVAGTAGKGNGSCTFARHGKNCRVCDFYKIVRKEEGDNIRPTFFLMKILEEETP